MNKFTRTVQMYANKRIFKYTAIVATASAIAKGSQRAVYGDLPAVANAGGFLGFTIDHFIEPGGIYFVAQGTAPTAVTGQTPSTYSLADKNVTIAYEGETFAIAAGVVAEGDLLAIAEFPEHITPAEISVAFADGGAVASINTSPLLTFAQAVEARNKELAASSCTIRTQRHLVAVAGS